VCPVAAQITASEEATFSQVIDGTRISMRYARPSRRGREVLFGGVMPWGERWTPGANVATTFRTSKDIQVGGYPVAEDAYSVWIDLVAGGPWQLVLDPDTALYHTEHPADSDRHLRFPVTPRSAPERETLLWTMDSIRADGGQLVMHWGTTLVSLSLTVPSSRRLTVTAEEAVPVLGEWEGTAPGPGDAVAYTFRVYRDETRGFLAGVMHDQAESIPGWEVVLLPAAEGVFAVGWGENGELWEVLPILIEFSTRGPGGYGRFDVRDEESDAVLWSGGRATGKTGG